MTLNVEFKNQTYLSAELKSDQTRLSAELKNTGQVLHSELNCPCPILDVELKCENHCVPIPFLSYQALQGYTPIKGVDYFTEKEIDEIAERAYELVQTGGQDTSNFIKTSQIGKNLEIDNVGKVNVLTTDNAEQDNTRPITSRAVNIIVGNIDALLEII